ncbi:hypothetical protein [Thalassomonas haliotis]|uniref:RDD domain-containing protein n=1 Tax=Thalassomonas haliotis TaxID=485448 RepID=A0ABY7VIE9_9GAMM|nr:hypothetical protein [Thalassomonas haliotis]WDE12805.1 hypothetical protein H3N35_04865 [Thalassomonas haliotis]
MNGDSFGPWKSLVNNTSPYAIPIYAPVNRYRLYGVIGSAIVILLLPISAQTLMSAAFVIFCSLWGYACFYLGYSGKKNRLLTCSLMMSWDGYCRFDRGPLLKLAVNSRIGFAGCWLILTDELLAMPAEQSRNRAAKPVISTFFIFKSSVSVQDYARLSRVVLSLKQHQVRGRGLE